MELVGLMKDDLSLPQDHALLVPADLHRTAVHIYHFPEIVLFPRKDEVIRKFVIMHGYDFRNVDHVVELRSHIAFLHIPFSLPNTILNI